MEDYEDIEINDTDHNKLLAAVAKLDKTQHIKRPTRNEPTNLNSEFNLNKSSNKLDIKEVVKVLENTAHHVQIGKKLKKAQQPAKVLSKPLEKPQAERIKRSIGYEQTKTKLGRWNSVVARSRTVDYMSFPLKATATKLQPTKDFLSKLKSKSPLELELDEIDPPAVEEKEDEEEPTIPMSYQDMLEHRQRLAKIRAQQSFRAAKAKRQSKIKSKKYHRMLKKDRLKKQFIEFEELQKTNPEEALKKLEALEKARALERHTLRHKNTGKWAKSKLVRAKYDKEVRQQLAEQLSVSRGLTQKMQVESSSDESDDKEVIPDFTLSQDPLQPWMITKIEKTNLNADAEIEKKKESDLDTDDDDDGLGDTNNTLPDGLQTKPLMIDEFTKQKKGTSKQSELKSTRAGPIIEEQLEEHNVRTTGDITKLNIKTAKKKESFKHNELKVQTPINIKSNAEIYDYKQREESLSRKTIKEGKPKENEGIENVNNLEFKNSNLKSIVDEQLDETDSWNIPKQGPQQVRIINIPETNQKTSNDSPRKVKSILKPTHLHSSLSQTEHDLDALDDDEHVVSKLNIEVAFEDEEIANRFRQEKEDEAKQDNPPDTNQTMPGWNSWGGKGVPKKRKSSRIIVKAAPKMPRRDENKGDIIIKEYKDPKLSAHKVTDVPFPFTTVKDYEASIRAPLGNTFITERVHQKLIKPSVITKIGTIIEPMDEDELLAPKNLNFKKQSILKLVDKR